MRWWRRLTAITLVVATGLVLAACQPATDPPLDGSADSAASAVFPDARVKPLVAAVPHRSVAPPPTMRLARGLIPPTNRWYSGLVFGTAPQPVFPLPISFGLTATGFAFGLPTVSAHPNVIAGGYDPQVSVDAGAANAVVTGYDDVSVTLEYRSASGSAIGRTTLAEGSPLVGFTAEADAPVRLALSVPFTPADGSSPAGDLATATIGGTLYALLAPSGALTKDGAGVRLTDGQSVILFPVPTGSTARAVAAAISGPLLGVDTTYSLTGSTARTELRYRARGGTSVFAALPTQARTAGIRCSLGRYASIYGEMTLCSGDRLAWSVPRITETAGLPLEKASASDRNAIQKQLRTDTLDTPALPADTYFGGKALYRLANLLTIARSLGVDDVADALRDRLSAALREWTDPAGCASGPDRCFVYDPVMHGMVGLAASFGSDQFNDHHFHYGYFLYAAGVLVADQPSVAHDLAPVMNLLAADLATGGSSTLFPERRTFDPYLGHSWASGYSPFADGNNQESSSEAVNAWNGLALWAGATDNTALATEARWMLSGETASALADWTNADLGAFKGFGHRIVAINWGGKRDYATWFSPDPNAMLGIQLIPMSPVATYLAGDPARIRANLAEATPNGYDVQFGDYLLMYSALAGPADAARARAASSTLPDASIDDADSRTYLLAWLATRG